MVFNDTTEVEGIYDSGSNVFLINSKLLKWEKENISNKKYKFKNDQWCKKGGWINNFKNKNF